MSQMVFYRLYGFPFAWCRNRSIRRWLNLFWRHRSIDLAVCHSIRYGFMRCATHASKWINNYKCACRQKLSVWHFDKWLWWCNAELTPTRNTITNEYSEHLEGERTTRWNRRRSYEWTCFDVENSYLQNGAVSNRSKKRLVREEGEESKSRPLSISTRYIGMANPVQQEGSHGKSKKLDYEKDAEIRIKQQRRWRRRWQQMNQNQPNSKKKNRIWEKK